jgi:hypothetical protein
MNSNVKVIFALNVKDAKKIFGYCCRSGMIDFVVVAVVDIVVGVDDAPWETFFH